MVTSTVGSPSSVFVAGLQVEAAGSVAVPSRGRSYADRGNEHNEVDGKRRSHVLAGVARGTTMAAILTDPAVVSLAIFVAWTALGTAVFIAVGDR